MATDDDIAYALTKAFWEGKEVMGESSPWWNGVDETMLENLSTPLHPARSAGTTRNPDRHALRRRADDAARTAFDGGVTERIRRTGGGERRTTVCVCGSGSDERGAT